MFNYIYEKLPEQRNYVDRLGRTFLHLIFEYDFTEALENINITLDDLFQEDYNGDYVINYTYIYNSSNCFFSFMIKPGRGNNAFKKNPPKELYYVTSWS